MEKEILYENKKIFYRSVGIGKPVMLVHGFGEDGNVWHNQIEFLKNKFHLIIPDLPGSGKSEMINDTSMEGMAEVLHAIIHEECYDKPEYKRNLQTSGDSGLMASPIGGGREGACIVIGHSMGGYITLALVEHYWNHVNAFGLFHSSAFPDSEEKKKLVKKELNS
jgi:pimeloyl-ACP methyl ester carboxylesterase